MAVSVLLGSRNRVVASMLGLKDIWLAPLEDGTFAFVESGVPGPFPNRALYVLSKESGATEDLITGAVVAPGPGSPEAGAPGGRWIALGPV